MTTKQKVENKIRELAPELGIKNKCKFSMEWLTSGNAKPTASNRRGRVVGTSKDGRCWWIVWEGNKTTSRECYSKDFIEIIGHPIHLEHVLRAVDNIKYSVSFDGNIIFLVENTDMWYDLTKPFSEQSEDLFKFLAEVLGVEE